MKTILGTFAAAGLVMILVTTAFASDWKMSADIPFTFNVGDKTLAGGKYTIEMSQQNGAVLLRSEENAKTTAISLSIAAITPRDLRNARLVFNGYGNDFFLSTLSWPDGPSRMLPPTSIEIKAAKGVTGRKLAVASK